MIDHHPHLSPWLILVAEVGAGVSGGHLLGSVPPWVGGGLSALFVGVVLRLLDPTLRRLGDRLAGRRSTPPPPPPVTP